MSNILETIADYTRKRVEASKEKRPLEIVRQIARDMAAKENEALRKTGIGADSKDRFPFEKALREGDISFICECKKASPSKGIIEPDFDPVKIAIEYEKAGASAISVLTEPKWFMGCNEYLSNIAETVNIPCLRKDFTVDEYMIYEAKTLNANAVLLICSITKEDILRKYIKICDELNLSALVEAHDEEEIAMALRCNARIIGVNNRNLKDFTVDINNSVRLRKLVPEDVCFVAESGIKTSEDIDVLRRANVNAILIGETLMRADNKREMLDNLRGGKA